MFDGIFFEFPKLAFLIVPFIACATLCKMRLPALYFPHTAQFIKNTAESSKLLFILKWLGVSMMIMALMSPVKEEEYKIKPTQGYDIALVLDASESMMEKGFDRYHPTYDRFSVVQNIVKDFVKERQNDNLGIVVFGQYSFIASPLTYDQHILSQVLTQLHVGMAGKFTAIYEALAQSVNLLKSSKAKTKIAILLTDGYNTPGGKIPLDVALDLAKQEKIRVYTIGIGGPREYNGALLDTIAKETGGVAFGAQTASQLTRIYKEIDRLEKSDIEAQSYTYNVYYFFYPLFVGLLSLLGFVYLRNRKDFA